MGRYCNMCASDTNAVQTFRAFSAFFGTPAFWQNALYFAGGGDPRRRFSVDASSGLFNTGATSESAHVFQFWGSTPSVSSPGTSSGIVWAIDSSPYGPPSSFGSAPALLHAYDATNLAKRVVEQRAGCREPGSGWGSGQIHRAHGRERAGLGRNQDRSGCLRIVSELGSGLSGATKKANPQRCNRLTGFGLPMVNRRGTTEPVTHGLPRPEDNSTFMSGLLLRGGSYPKPWQLKGQNHVLIG